ncbi:MT-A70-domain-containing protein [Aspergillus carlsbadensis]|nr:MT-A70-domain-containing protein [Aspergillus carlsbadensis]
MPHTSILYQNNDATIFLIDIPTSIALAQSLSKQTPSERHLLSSPALETPYPPLTEPKTAAARARVLERTPRSERAVAAAIEPVVLGALAEIRGGFQDRKWCFERCLVGNKDGDVHEPGSGNSNEGGRSGGVALGKRRRKGEADYQEDDQSTADGSGIQASAWEQPAETMTINQPPLILSAGLNRFTSGAELRNHIVKNTSPSTATVSLCSQQNSPSNIAAARGQQNKVKDQNSRYTIPPLSTFFICSLPISSPLKKKNKHNPIPGLGPNQEFNLILLDPPWSNRSVRRSGHYQMQSYSHFDLLTKWVCDVLRVHSFSAPPSPALDGGEGKVASGREDSSRPDTCVAAIWITNSAKARRTAYDSLTRAGFTVTEEWVWIKTTLYGEPVTPVEGLWRKPYEVLVVGVKKENEEKEGEEGTARGIRRRVIAGVPDVHSRKPNLREVFERVFFSSSSSSAGAGAARMRYEALEVFARNLTAGWWACGDEVLKFNDGEWWADGDA